MVNKKKEPKKVVRKVKKSGLVKLKPSLSEDIKKAKVGRPKKIPTKREAYAKHKEEAQKGDQHRQTRVVLRHGVWRARAVAGGVVRQHACSLRVGAGGFMIRRMTDESRG